MASQTLNHLTNPSNPYYLNFYTYCGRNNHIVDTCYQKQGFPPGYKFKKGATKSADMAASVNAKKMLLLSRLIHQILTFRFLKNNNTTIQWL